MNFARICFMSLLCVIFAGTSSDLWGDSGRREHLLRAVAEMPVLNADRDWAVVYMFPAGSNVVALREGEPRLCAAVGVFRRSPETNVLDTKFFPTVEWSTHLEASEVVGTPYRRRELSTRLPDLGHMSFLSLEYLSVDEQGNPKRLERLDISSSLSMSRLFRFPEGLSFFSGPLGFVGIDAVHLHEWFNFPDSQMRFDEVTDASPGRVDVVVENTRFGQLTVAFDQPKWDLRSIELSRAWHHYNSDLYDDLPRVIDRYAGRQLEPGEEPTEREKQIRDYWKMEVLSREPLETGGEKVWARNTSSWVGPDGREHSFDSEVVVWTYPNPDDAPIRPGSFDEVPDGTPVTFSDPPDGLPREWRGGQVVVWVDPEAVERAEAMRPAAVVPPELGQTRRWVFPVVAASILLTAAGVGWAIRRNARRGA